MDYVAEDTSFLSAITSEGEENASIVPFSHIKDEDCLLSVDTSCLQDTVDGASVSSSSSGVQLIGPELSGSLSSSIQKRARGKQLNEGYS